MSLTYETGVPCKNKHLSPRYKNGGGCLQCHKEAEEKRKLKNPQRRRSYMRMRSYGITEEEYKRLFELQKGLCAICNLSEKRIIKGILHDLCVDHCKITKRIRGLLCFACNVSIGHLNHSPELLRKAAIYCE